LNRNKHENGDSYWLASELFSLLGYDNIDNFKEPIGKAKDVLELLKIPIEENFTSFTCPDGSEDYKLSRFACYIIVMNSDSKKEEVARAQIYFAEQTRKFEIMVQTNNDLERLRTRGELILSNKILNATLSQHGIEKYAKFHDAGYLGLYNMCKFKVEQVKNLPKGTLLERMGRTELAANLMKTTLTEEKIRKEQITGQQNLENTHKKIGKGVRELIKDSVGMYPEDLPAETAIIKIKKDLKSVQKEMIKQDKKKSKREKSKGKS